jgi:hypothetical protein
VWRAHHFADLQKFGTKNKSGYRQQQRYGDNDTFSSPLWLGLRRTV